MSVKINTSQEGLHSWDLNFYAGGEILWNGVNALCMCMHSIGISAVYNCTLTTTKKEMEEDFVVTVTNVAQTD